VSNAGKVTASGRGLQPHGLRALEPVDFKVRTYMLLFARLHFVVGPLSFFTLQSFTSPHHQLCSRTASFVLCLVPFCIPPPVLKLSLVCSCLASWHKSAVINRASYAGSGTTVYTGILHTYLCQLFNAFLLY
jgi:hypothetical protein